MDNGAIHDFGLLKGHYSHLKDSDELLSKFGFDSYNDFLHWIIETLPDGEQFGCGSCCRSLLPRFITISEEKSGIKFNELLKNEWNKFNEKQKLKALSNYKHYFIGFDLTIPRSFVLKCKKNVGGI